MLFADLDAAKEFTEILMDFPIEELSVDGCRRVASYLLLSVLLFWKTSRPFVSSSSAFWFVNNCSFSKQLQEEVGWVLWRKLCLLFSLSLQTVNSRLHCFLSCISQLSNPKRQSWNHSLSGATVTLSERSSFASSKRWLQILQLLCNRLPFLV